MLARVLLELLVGLSDTQHPLIMVMVLAIQVDRSAHRFQDWCELSRRVDCLHRNPTRSLVR